VKQPPDRPWVTVPRNRTVGVVAQKAAHITWRRMDARDVVDGWVTAPLRTVLDCAAALPFDEALSVADSALRAGDVTTMELVDAAGRWPARGRARVRRVAANASSEAANPFESVLRAICSDVPGLRVTPQVQIGGDDFFARVDLADVRLRVVLEADSFQFHGGRERLRHDCWRYDELVARGWFVLRFAWEQVMFAPDWVRSILVAAVERAHQRALVA
jgi:very-short-patch-repair endonuclease